jgi:phospholipid-binding lipoprotein MlaA
MALHITKKKTWSTRDPVRIRSAPLLVIGVSFAMLVGACASKSPDQELDRSVAASTDIAGESPTDGPIVDDPNVVSSEGHRGPPDDSVVADPNVVSFDDYNDPLMPMNRFFFKFNNVAARYVFVPLGKGYVKIMPDPVERGIENFFDNARTPIYAINDVFQGKFKPSGKNFARFGINTTIGLLGLFDPAKAWFGLERSPSDFAETLAHYNVGYGSYLVLPIFGPSDFRNATARGVDYFLQPIPYLLDRRDTFAVLGFGVFHDFSQQAEEYEKIREGLEDPYIFFRNMHLQSIQRDAAYRR